MAHTALYKPQPQDRVYSISFSRLAQIQRRCLYPCFMHPAGSGPVPQACGVYLVPMILQMSHSKLPLPASEAELSRAELLLSSLQRLQLCSGLPKRFLLFVSTAHLSLLCLAQREVHCMNSHCHSDQWSRSPRLISTMLWRGQECHKS